jgi:hypothetical protein
VIKTTKRKSAVPNLAKGQLWKLNHAYIQIVDLGKRLLQYKMMSRPDEMGARTLMSGVDTMWGYLKSRHARLVSQSAN